MNESPDLLRAARAYRTARSIYWIRRRPVGTQKLPGHGTQSIIITEVYAQGERGAKAKLFGGTEAEAKEFIDIRCLAAAMRELRTVNASKNSNNPDMQIAVQTMLDMLLGE